MMFISMPPRKFPPELTDNTMLTCYDVTFAHELSTAGVEMLHIGDTLGMILQVHDNALPVRLEDMVYHTACVKR